MTPQPAFSTDAVKTAMAETILCSTPKSSVDAIRGDRRLLRARGLYPDRPMAEGKGRDVYSELKYVVYWRNEDGRWKWDVDMWNRNA